MELTGRSALISRNSTALRMFAVLASFSSCFISSGEPAYGSLESRTISVKLFSARKALRRVEFVSPVRISVNGEPDFKVEAVTVEYDRGGLKLIGQPKSGHPKIQQPGKTGSVMVVNTDNGLPITLRVYPNTTRGYKGRLVILPKRIGEIQVINKVRARDYIDSVVGAEAPLQAPAEMLKAQAVLAQTLVERIPASEVIDDSTQTQVYKGIESERPEAILAVAKVWGERLTFEGRPVKVFYHSTCAGATSAAASYFHLTAGSLPYLRHVKCDYCKESPFWKPKFSPLPERELKAFCGGALPVVLKKDAGDRPLFVKTGSGKIISGYQFWLKIGQRFGWDKVPGTRFSLIDNGNRQVVFSSTGAGHGVGLCQWGAVGMAKEGKTYEEILAFYYPGAKIE